MTDPSSAVVAAPTVTRPFAGRRLIVQAGWEVLLAVAAIGTVLALLVSQERATLLNLLAQVAPLGLAGAAMALSLRTGTPNLAVGALASLAGLIGAKLAADSMPVAGAMAIGVAVATLAGLLIGVIVAALSVPSWAVTLGAAGIVEAIVIGSTAGRVVPVRGLSGHPQWVWFTVFAVVSLAGGALWLIPGVRQALSRSRNSVASGRWAGVRAGLGAIVGLTGSGFLAGLAGVALVMRLHASTLGMTSSLTLAGLAVAALGGASLFGRRAGVTGTLFAALLLGAISQLLAIQGVASWVNMLALGVAVVVGAAVTRAIESISGELPS